MGRKSIRSTASERTLNDKVTETNRVYSSILLSLTRKGRSKVLEATTDPIRGPRILNVPILTRQRKGRGISSIFIKLTKSVQDLLLLLNSKRGGI